MAINFRGYLFQDDGDAVNGATVQLLETGTTTVEASTTTDSNGLWYFNEGDQDKYDVKITSGTSVRYIRWDDQISLKEIDIRNNTGNTTPAATFTNLTNNAANQVAVFSGANTTRADDDEIYTSFKLANSAAELIEYGRMTVVAKDVTDGTEDGQIEFDVMKAGTLTKVWTITSSDAAAMSFDMNVDSLTIGSGADTDISLTFDANTADGVITWMEDEDYFQFSDEILMNSTEKILFGDTATFIHQSSDGVMTIDGEATIDLNASTAVLVSNDLKLNSDSAVLGFGADNDTTLTHTDGTGLTLNSTNKLTFGDTGTFIHQSSDGVLTITSDTTVDINGAVEFDGALTGITNITLSGTLSDGNYTFDTSGNVSGLGTVSSGTITTSGNIELGHASDTTIARSGSGAITVEGTQVLLAGAQTGITTITNASLVVGRDADNDIDFTTDNNIRFRAGGEDQLTLTDGALTPSSNAIVDLGTDALEFKDAYFDGTLEADAITIGGTNIVTGSLITTLGTISAGTWNGTAIASAYLDSDTAHLSGTQTFTGAKTFTDTVTVGVDDDGKDVKFFGETAGSYMLWDESEDDLILAGVPKLFIGDTANSNQTIGLTINAAGNEGEIITLKASDFGGTDADGSGHDMTAKTESDTYGFIGKSSSTQGGLVLKGYSSAKRGMQLVGAATTDDTAKDVNANSHVVIRCETYDGSTSVTTPGTDANLLTVRGPGGTVRFIWDIEGSAHADVEWTTYDKEDDLGLVKGMEQELLLREDEGQTERRKYLETVGIIGKNSWHMENGKQRAMINTTKLSMLHHGALIQVADKLDRLSEENKQLRQKLEALEV